MPKKSRLKRRAGIRCRELNGRARRGKSRPARDSGTDEAVARRLIMARGGDPAKTAHALDLLHDRAAITAFQMQAGLRFAWLHSLVYGCPQHALAQRYERLMGLPAKEDHPKLAERQIELRHAYARLTRGEKAVLYEAVIFCGMPLWLDEAYPDGKLMLDRLERALDKLVEVFGRGARAA